MFFYSFSKLVLLTFPASFLFLGIGEAFAPLMVTMLAVGGEPMAVIMVTDSAPVSDQTAAKELTEYLFKVAGCKFAVIQESEEPKKVPCVCVGGTAYARSHAFKSRNLKTERWVIRIVTEHAVLVGGAAARCLVCRASIS